MGLFRSLKDKLGQAKKSRPFCSAVVAAGGNSERFGENKLFLEICGIPVIACSLITLSSCPEIDEIIISARKDDILAIGDIVKGYNIPKVKHIVSGGSTRLKSVLNGINECSARAKLIAVHDAARPLVGIDICSRTINAAAITGAAIPVVPVKDTIKICENRQVRETPDRASLYHVQTPQVFEADLIDGALTRALNSGINPTDDCAAVEAMGMTVTATEGSYFNIKITTYEDILAAEAYAERVNNENWAWLRCTPLGK